MFGSISTATPNTIVTSSFTADRVCSIGIGSEYTVRRNGQIVTTRPINLIIGDVIAVDVLSPGPDNYIFVPWTFDGVQSYFAVVTREATNTPKLVREFRGKAWFDFTTSNGFLVRRWEPTENFERGLLTAFIQNTTRVVDTAVLLNPTNNTAVYYEPGENLPRRIVQLDNVPQGITKLYNSATLNWEMYVLLVDGHIHRILHTGAISKTVTPIPNAKSIFSDGINLYVGGVNFVSVLSDMFTIASTITVPNDTILYGVALGTTAMFCGSSGRIYRLNGTTLETAYQGTTIGAPTTFKNEFVFPVTEEYILKVFSSNGTFLRDVSVGSKLPWAITEYRDLSVAVTYADSPSVEVFTNLVGTPTPTLTRTFSQKATFAQTNQNVLYTNHHLREFTMTVPANPPISGVDFPTWRAPVNVDVGTGEFVATTQGSDLRCVASPGTTLLVNGVKNVSTFNNSNRISLFTRSQEGRKRVALVLGNYAYDFRVNADVNASFSTQANIVNQLLNSQVVFDVTVPPRVVSAPFAVSHGTVRLNGATYNGTTPVNAGDIIRVTINVPPGATSYYSMLSIADSQFALTINTAATRNSDIQRFQNYLATDTKSTIVVEETGIYDFPNYTYASVSKNGSQLNFPTTLTAGDTVEITHNRMSSWWFDERSTILLGPSVNYRVVGITQVDGAPDNVSFGFVRLGIPDFPFQADGQATISGLSDGYSVEIFGDGLEFTVNGGPLTARPLVKNGDVVTATYTVRNLWENRFAKVLLDDGEEYEFGLVNVDPPLGINFDAAQETYLLNTMWMEHETLSFQELESVGPDSYQYDYVGTDVAPATFFTRGQGQESDLLIGSRYADSSELEAPRLFGDWQRSYLQLPTPSSEGLWQESFVNQVTDSSLPEMYDNNSFPTSEVVPWISHRSDTFRIFDNSESFEPAYGYSVEIRVVDKEFFHLIENDLRNFVPFFSYGSPDVMITGQPFWEKQFASSMDLVDMTWSRNALENSNPITLLGTKYLETPHRGVSRTTVFANSDSKLLMVTLNVGFVPSFRTILYSTSAIRQSAMDYSTMAPVGNFVPARLVRNLQPLGAFDTLEDALQAGSRPGLVIEPYQQPEGKFSYIIRRETGLVCPIIPSSIFSTKWLLGGG
jgi:hypothetical protein